MLNYSSRIDFFQVIFAKYEQNALGTKFQIYRNYKVVNCLKNFITS